MAMLTCRFAFCRAKGMQGSHNSCLGNSNFPKGNHTQNQCAQVFVEDMLEHPNNGYALLGVAQSLRSLGRDADAEQIQGVFEKAWEHADGPLETPCPAFSRLIATRDTGYGVRRRLALRRR